MPAMLVNTARMMRTALISLMDWAHIITSLHRRSPNYSSGLSIRLDRNRKKFQVQKKTPANFRERESPLHYGKHSTSFTVCFPQTFVSLCWRKHTHAPARVTERRPATRPTLLNRLQDSQNCVCVCVCVRSRAHKHIGLCICLCIDTLCDL